MAAGALGASWTTGLAMLARGLRPQILCIGSGTWQLIALQTMRQGILILAGEFEEFPETPARRLLGILRPRIDLVVGRQAALDLMSPTSLRRLADASRIVLDRGMAQGAPNRTVTVGSGVAVTLDPFQMRLSPVHENDWNAGTSQSGWLAEIDVNGVTLAIGPTLDLLARHANVRTTLAIAPSGHLAYLHRVLPHVAVATNAESAEAAGFLASSADTDQRDFLVARTFAGDVATFRIRNGAIQLPPWTESMSRQSG
jgi:hypothetical protein